MSDFDLLIAFLRRLLKSIVRYALIGGAIMAGVGLVLYGLGMLFGTAVPPSLNRLLSVMGNYALFGALGGALIGMLYGLLGQRT